jgi:hypothetical protein
MEEQISPSNFPPVQQSMTLQQGITPEQLEQLKARAREAAIMQTYQQQQQQKPVVQQINEPLPSGTYYAPISSSSSLSPKVVYVKRSLTVAEIGLMLLLSCGIVFGIQLAVNFAVNTLPRIEIKMK